MTTKTQPACDENHCFCNSFDEYGDIACKHETMPETLEQIVSRILNQLDVIDAEIQSINDKLKNI